MISNWFHKMILAQNLNWSLENNAFSIKILFSATQLKTFNFQVMSLEGLMLDQQQCYLLFLNFVIFPLMMPIKLQLLEKVGKLIFKMEKESTYSCLTEVDQWEELEYKKPNKLLSSSSKVYLKIHISM